MTNLKNISLEVASDYSFIDIMQNGEYTDYYLTVDDEGRIVLKQDENNNDPD